MENQYLREQITRLNGGQPIQPMPQQMIEQAMMVQTPSMQQPMQMMQPPSASSQTRLPPIHSANNRQGTGSVNKPSSIMQASNYSNGSMKSQTPKKVKP